MSEPTVAQLIALHKLAAYGLSCLEASRESFSDLDGGWLQDEAVRLGVLATVQVAEACGEDCTCAEWDDFPQECYRLADDCAEIRERVRTFNATTEAQMTTQRDGSKRAGAGLETSLAVGAQETPAGWRLVPVEPTIEMLGAFLEAGFGRYLKYCPNYADFVQHYRAMLAAAPVPEDTPPKEKP